MSSPRPEPVAVVLVLPNPARVVARFFDDGSVRDLTAFAADLLAEYLVRAGSGSSEASGDVVVAEVAVEGCAWGDIELALVDLRSHQVGDVPAENLPHLLGSAIALAVTDAVRDARTAPQAADEQ